MERSGNAGLFLLIFRTKILLGVCTQNVPCLEGGYIYQKQISDQWVDDDLHVWFCPCHWSCPPYSSQVGPLSLSLMSSLLLSTRPWYIASTERFLPPAWKRTSWLKRKQAFFQNHCSKASVDYFSDILSCFVLSGIKKHWVYLQCMWIPWLLADLHQTISLRAGTKFNLTKFSTS